MASPAAAPITSSSSTSCAVCAGVASQSCSRCCAIRYCGREHQLAHWPVHKITCAPCVVRASENGLGAGLWATRAIKIGERILSEVPLISIPTLDDSAEEIIQARFKTLSSADQSKVLAFTDTHCAAGKDPTLFGICITNQLPCADGESGIFERICRANHCCLPNAEYSWCSSINKQVLHAVRPIDADSEILVSYVSAAPFMTLDQRRAHLLAGFKFTCGCRLCATLLADPAAAQASDKRRSEMSSKMDELMDPMIAHQPAVVLELTNRLVELFNEEGYGSTCSPLARVHFRAFQALICHTRFLDQAKSHIELACETYSRAKGSDSDVMRMYTPLVAAPSSHPDAGVLDVPPSSTSGSTNQKRSKGKKK